MPGKKDQYIIGPSHASMMANDDTVELVRTRRDRRKKAEALLRTRACGVMLQRALERRVGRDGFLWDHRVPMHDSNPSFD